MGSGEVVLFGRGGLDLKCDGIGARVGQAQDLGHLLREGACGLSEYPISTIAFAFVRVRTLEAQLRGVQLDRHDVGLPSCSFLTRHFLLVRSIANCPRGVLWGIWIGCRGRQAACDWSRAWLLVVLVGVGEERGGG